MNLYSEPVTVASGQIKVTVTLPQYNNSTFDGYSRDAQLAKWAAAKTAVNRLQNKSNEYVPIRSREIFQRYKNTN